MAGDMHEARELDVVWSDVENLPLHFVNQMVAQMGAPAGAAGVPDGITLLFGCASPPLIVGSAESVRQQMEELSSVTVRPVGRFVMSRDRAEELLQVLARAVGQYDEIVEAGQHAHS